MRTMAGLIGAMAIVLGCTTVTPTGAPSSSPSTPRPVTSPSGAPSPALVPSPSPVSLSASGDVDNAGSFGTAGLWAIDGQRLLISSDIGRTWQSRELPIDPTSMFGGWRYVAVDARHAWLVRYGPKVKGLSGAAIEIVNYLVDRTSDGGATWHTATVPGNYPGTIPAVSFADAEHGYLLAVATRLSFGVSTALRTTDGGATWRVAGTGKWLDAELAASNATTIWAGGQEQAGGSFDQPMLAVSRDAGKTWHDTMLPGLPGTTEATCGCYLPGPPVFSNASAGFVAVVNSFGSVGQYGTWIETTSDGGRTWSQAAHRPDVLAAAVAQLDSSHWLMAEVNPTVVSRSDDGGTTWQAVASDGFWPAVFPVWMRAFDGSTAVAFVQGPGDTTSSTDALLITDDGGRTWRQVIPG
jgi:photosystem II stability/assembly factor-like uncharacterized protein